MHDYDSKHQLHHCILPSSSSIFNLQSSIFNPPPPSNLQGIFLQSTLSHQPYLIHLCNAMQCNSMPQHTIASHTATKQHHSTAPSTIHTHPKPPLPSHHSPITYTASSECPPAPQTQTQTQTHNANKLQTQSSNSPADDQPHKNTTQAEPSQAKPMQPTNPPPLPPRHSNF